MSKEKADFIREIQSTNQPLSPYEISQLIRISYNWVSLYKGDPELKSAFWRGYMVRPDVTHAYTPENPAIYWCVIALDQPKGWQHVTWIKEMLQIIDSASHYTSDKDKLGAMLETRRTTDPNGDGTPLNVVADKHGFILALACAVPREYRETLRKGRFLERVGQDAIANITNIPPEYVDRILDIEFEIAFEKALKEIEAEG